MKHTLLFFLLVVFTGFTKAQNWCPPGATWHFRLYNDSSDPNVYRDGTLKLEYTDTATVNNHLCQVIKGTFYGASEIEDPGSYTVTNWVTYRTYENNNVVYIFNVSAQQFDTIANFNAHPGDSWFYGLNTSFCTDLQVPRNKVTVYDTGHVTINGLSLKKLVVSPPAATTPSLLIERIGGFPGFLFFQQDCTLDGSSLGNFSCYQDNAFPVYKQVGVTECVIITVSIKEQQLADGAIKLYPNPNAGNFKLDLLQPVKTSVFNTLGALVSQENYDRPGSYSVDISNMPAGLYYFKASNQNGSGYVKIIKQ